MKLYYTVTLATTPMYSSFNTNLKNFRFITNHLPSCILIPSQHPLTHCESTMNGTHMPIASSSSQMNGVPTSSSAILSHEPPQQSNGMESTSAHSQHPEDYNSNVQAVDESDVAHDYAICSHLVRLLTFFLLSFRERLICVWMIVPVRLFSWGMGRL